MSTGDVRVQLRSGTAGGVLWYLTSRNGRVLGRSAIEHVDPAAGVAALRDLCAEASLLVAQVSHAPTSLGWVWSVVSPSGTVAALGDRSFPRYGTCLSAGARFLATARALAGTDIEHLHVAGVRRRPAPDLLARHSLVVHVDAHGQTLPAENNDLARGRGPAPTRVTAAFDTPTPTSGR